MLQQLLNLGLMPIGSDDSRFAKMEAASEAFAEAVKQEPALLVPATLIAIHNDVPEDEPTFAAVEKFVVDQWKTLRNTHSDRPRELFRSIIIQALDLVAQESPEAAGVVWHTAISPFNLGQARLGKEAELVKDLLCRVGETTEREALVRAEMVEMAPQEHVSKKPGKKSGLELRPYSELKSDELIIDVASAAGPQYPAGTGLSNGNPNWPNSPDAWAYQFSPRMTSALVKAVNVGVGRLAESMASSMSQYNATVNERLTDEWGVVQNVLAGLSAARQAGRMRLDVLWWSEAKYSPALMCGYRELPPAVAALAMAHDLSQLVPALSPASVTYVLGEAMASLSAPDAQANRRSIRDLLCEVAAEGSVMATLFPDPTTTVGRVPLTDLVIEAARGHTAIDGDVTTRAGVDGSLAVTAREFAMWLFHDVLARKLVEDLK